VDDNSQAGADPGWEPRVPGAPTRRLWGLSRSEASPHRVTNAWCESVFLTMAADELIMDRCKK